MINIVLLSVGNKNRNKQPETVEIPAQMASNTEKVSIGWRHHVMTETSTTTQIQNLEFLVSVPWAFQVLLAFN